MNDWWNDPPEELEVPGCPECDGDADCLHEEKYGQILKCGKCEHKWWVPHPKELVLLEVVEYVFKKDVPVVSMGKCPHGKKWGDCDACDFASDIAFDTARENRIFGR